MQNFLKYNYKIKPVLPKGLLWSGLTAIFLVLTMIPFLAWLLEYKDTIQAPLTITTETQPVDVYARATGELLLFVADQEPVEPNQVLGLVKSPADYDQVQRLQVLLEQPATSPLVTATDLYEADLSNLGELEPAYVEVVKRIKGYRAFRRTDRHRSLIKSRRNQIAAFEKRKNILREKRGLIESESTSASDFAAASDELFQRQGLTKRELREFQKDEVESKVASLDNATSINDIDIQIERLRQQNISEKSNYEARLLQQVNAVKDALQLLNGAMDTWEETYLLRSKVAGRIIFKDYLNDFRFVEAGEKVFSLLPDTDQSYLALLKMPAQGAGKVATGDTVYVKLHNYPFMEFGVLKGQVTEISPLPFADQYNVQGTFPNGFVSSYGQTFPTAPLMAGTGEIMVERRSLLERVLNQVKSARLNR